MESGRSAMPSAAAAIASAGCAAIVSRTQLPQLRRGPLGQQRRRFGYQEAVALGSQARREALGLLAAASSVSAPARVLASTSPATRVSCRAPELEGHVATHRKAAHDRAVDARGVERPQAPVGRGAHRHHRAGIAAAAEPGQVRCDHGPAELPELVDLRRHMRASSGNAWMNSTPRRRGGCLAAVSVI